MALGLMSIGCERIEKHNVTCRILSIDKQTEQHGDSESFHTDIYWLVTTDNGTYHITTDGLWACPEAVGKLKVDSTYTLTINGWFKSSFLGVYPYIVKVK